MVREIVVVEDPRLLTKCPRVPRIDDSTRRLIDDMVDTMRDAPGIGLAAPQVGVLLRVIVCEVDEHLHALVNPEIVRAEGEQVGDEGCLSIPGYVGEVKRFERVVVKAKNRAGKDVRVRAEGPRLRWPRRRLLISRCRRRFAVPRCWSGSGPPSPICWWWPPTVGSCRPSYWRRRRWAPSTSMPRCCRAGAARPRSPRRFSPATRRRG